MRCALTIAYNGAHFLGSQIQSQTTNTIFGNLQSVLLKLGIDCKVIASGRNDKGVHATRQVCHIDLPTFWNDLDKLKKVLNEMLPHAITVKNIKKVSDKFHARYSAKRRIYRYIIKEGDTTPFEYDFITSFRHVDFDKLQKNIKLFVGEHDFKDFMKTGSDLGSTTRVIYKAFSYRHKDLVILNFEANRFLRSQIRFMVSALLKLNADGLQVQLACANNYKLKPAPSNGLYLARIKY